MMDLHITDSEGLACKVLIDLADETVYIEVTILHGGVQRQVIEGFLVGIVYDDDGRIENLMMSLTENWDEIATAPPFTIAVDLIAEVLIPC